LASLFGFGLSQPQDRRLRVLERVQVPEWSGQSSGSVAGAALQFPAYRFWIRIGFGCEKSRKLMSKNIYVGNLPFQTSADDLRAMFEPYGEVTRAQIATDRETGRSRGFGFVEMSSGGDEAIAALNGQDIGGRSLTVNDKTENRQKNKGNRRVGT